MEPPPLQSFTMTVGLCRQSDLKPSTVGFPFRSDDMFLPKSFFVGFQVLLFLLSFQAVASRKWRDTGGGIILEEAWTIPDLLFQVRFV